MSATAEKHNHLAPPFESQKYTPGTHYSTHYNTHIGLTYQCGVALRPRGTASSSLSNPFLESSHNDSPPNTTASQTVQCWEQGRLLTSLSLRACSRALSFLLE